MEARGVVIKRMGWVVCSRVFKQGGDKIRETTVVHVDEPFSVVDGEAQSDPREPLKVARNGVKGTTDVPEGDEGDLFVDVSSFDMIKDIVQWHGGARVEAIAILVRVKNAARLPDEVDPSSNDGGHDLTEGLVQTDRPHVVEISGGGALRNESN
jgi:hypothetical protein